LRPDCGHGAVVAVVGAVVVGPVLVVGAVVVGPVVVGPVVVVGAVVVGRVVVGAAPVEAVAAWVRCGRVNGLGWEVAGWAPPARISAASTPAAVAAARPAVTPT
jgi:hypothetical protein